MFDLNHLRYWFLNLEDLPYANELKAIIILLLNLTPHYIELESYIWNPYFGKILNVLLFWESDAI